MSVSAFAFVGTMAGDTFWSAGGDDGGGKLGGLWSCSWDVWDVEVSWLAVISNWQIEVDNIRSSWKDWWHHKWGSKVWELDESGLSDSAVLFVGWAEFGDLSEESTINWSSVISTVFVVVLNVLDAITIRCVTSKTGRVGLCQDKNNSESGDGNKIHV